FSPDDTPAFTIANPPGPSATAVAAPIAAHRTGANVDQLIRSAEGKRTSEFRDAMNGHATRETLDTGNTGMGQVYDVNRLHPNPVAEIG
ncbi:MAG: hypothetical protein RLZ19_533, partial [Actinomycetota bacterium]